MPKNYRRSHHSPGKHQALHPLLKLLPRAHRMMENGQHADAAKIFTDLAQKTEDRGMSQIAPHLYLQAGRAYLLSNQVQTGVERLLHGLAILQTEGRWGDLDRASRQISIDVEQLGFPEHVQTIQTWLDKVIPDSFVPETRPEIERGRLPIYCPTCEGVLKPNEVTRLSDDRLACPFCGIHISLNP